LCWRSLALLPLVWFTSEQQKQQWLVPATSDPRCGYLDCDRPAHSPVDLIPQKRPGADDLIRRRLFDPKDKPSPNR
jgi:hypothetical protein